MSNTNWADSDLPRPPVPSPAPRPVNRVQALCDALAAEVERAEAEISTELEDLAVLQLQRELYHADECKVCANWIFGDGIQCEKHGYEG